VGRERVSWVEPPKLAKKARLQWDPHEQKYLLLYPERGLLLNEAAGAVVLLCDGRNDASRIADIVAARFAMFERDAVLSGIKSFFERLDALGLLERAESTRQ
jgi:pyrroloquinoline quinone biosynthesis protein D